MLLKCYRCAIAGTKERRRLFNENHKLFCFKTFQSILFSGKAHIMNLWNFVITQEKETGQFRVLGLIKETVFNLYAEHILISSWINSVYSWKYYFLIFLQPPFMCKTQLDHGNTGSDSPHVPFRDWSLVWMGRCCCSGWRSESTSFIISHRKSELSALHACSGSVLRLRTCFSELKLRRSVTLLPSYLSSLELSSNSNSEYQLSTSLC